MRLSKTSTVWCLLLSALAANPLADCRADHDLVIRESQRSGFAVAIRQPTNTAKVVRRHIIVVDTSASQTGAVRETSLQLVDQLIGQLPGDSSVQLLAVDVTCEPLTNGFVRPGSGSLKAAAEELAKRTPLGTTNLKAALDYAHHHAASDEPTSVLYIGDGLSASEMLTSEDVQLVVRRLVQSNVSIHSAVIGPRTNSDLPAVLANLTGGTCRDAKQNQQDLSKDIAESLAVAPTAIAGLQFDDREMPLLIDGPILVRPDRHTIVLGRGKLGMFEQLTSLNGSLSFDRQACRRTTNVEALPKLIQQAGPLGINVPFASLEMLTTACESYDAGVQQLGQAQQLLARRGEHLKAKKVRAMLTAMQEAEDLPPPPPADGVSAPADENPFGDNPAAVEPGVANDVPAVEPPAGGEFVPDGFGGKAEAPTDELENLENVIKLQTQILVAETNQAIDEANRVSFDQPEYAISLLKDTFETIESSTDISPDIRSELSRRVRAAISSVQNRRATNELMAKQRARDIAVESAQKKVIAQQIEDENRMANLIDQVRGLLYRGRQGDRNAFENAESVSRDALDLKPGSGPATQALVMSEALGQLDKAYRLVNLRHDRFLEVLYQVELSHVPFPDEPPIQYPPADVWRALTLTRKPRYESFDLRQEKPVEKWLRQMLDKPVPRLDYPGDAPLSEILDEISQYFNTTYGELEGKPLRMTIFEDTAEFELEGINSLEDVTVRDVQFQGITLRNALKLIFEKTTEPALTYIIQDEVFKVTTLAKAESDDNLVTRVYPVADLVIPPIQLGGGGGIGGQGAGFGGGQQGGFGGQQGGGFGGGGGGFGGQGGGGGFGGGQFSLPPEVLNVLQDANAGINNQNLKKKPVLN